METSCCPSGVGEAVRFDSAEWNESVDCIGLKDAGGRDRFTPSYRFKPPGGISGTIGMFVGAATLPKKEAASAAPSDTFRGGTVANSRASISLAGRTGGLGDIGAG